MKPIAVYVHTPFCPSKCGYCDFNSYAMTGEIMERAVRATIQEIMQSAHRGRVAKTIYFGGGTPTFLSSEQLSRLLAAVVDVHGVTEDCEITTEANPGTVDASKFADLKRAGFNRISIGAQSFDASDLIKLGRVHSVNDVDNAVRAARNAGFENISIDLMFGLSGQSRGAWRENLRRAFDLETEHVSLYCLTIEPNTAYYKLHLRGMLDLPNDEEQTRMYDEAVETAAQRGYLQYEISNFAKVGFESRHNLAYWRCEEYVGYGPGAVERVGDKRWTHIKHPLNYSIAVEAGDELSCEKEELSQATLERERVMLGLRLNEGIERGEIDERVIADCISRGWVADGDERIRLTAKGRHFCNEVIVSLF